MAAPFAARPLVTMACQAHDRMQPLRDGTVRLGGARLNFLDLPVEETFFPMLRFEEFDAAALSLSSYVLPLGRGAPFVALPVFPSQAFRHSGVSVRADSPMTDPARLSGGRWAHPSTRSPPWCGFAVSTPCTTDWTSPPVRYRTGGLDEPGRTEKLSLNLSPGVDVRAMEPGRTLSRLLLAGELDAVYSARGPDRSTPREAAGSAACSRIRWPSSRTTTPGAGSSRSCTRW